MSNDKKIVLNQKDGDQVYGMKVCLKCRKHTRIRKEFNYCPYCGSKELKIFSGKRSMEHFFTKKKAEDIAKESAARPEGQATECKKIPVRNAHTDTLGGTIYVSVRNIPSIRALIEEADTRASELAHTLNKLRQAEIEVEFSILEDE